MPAATGDQQAPRPQEVFISYSRKDKEFVRRLHEALKRRDWEAWVDWEDIRPTEEWMQAIYGAIEGAHTFVFVLAPDSVASVPCGREIAHAAAHNKRLVRIVARNVNADTVREPCFMTIERSSSETNNVEISSVPSPAYRSAGTLSGISASVIPALWLLTIHKAISPAAK
jgi:hypothetical protein